MSGEVVTHASGDGSTNYCRLVTLLVEEGTARLRHYLMTHLPHGMTLDQTLRNNYQKLMLLKEKDKRITGRQWGLIFPRDIETVNVNGFDLSLCVLLIRHIAYNEHHINWSKKPGAQNQYIEHDIVRLRFIRNDLSHMESGEISGQDFCKKWHDMSSILMKLGTSVETISEYLNRNLDPEATDRYCNQMREQYVEDKLQVLIMEQGSRRCFMISIFSTIIVGILIVTAVIAAIMIQNHSSCSDNVQLIRSDKNIERYIPFLPRSGWGAKKPKLGRDKFSPRPMLKYVIVADTMTPGRYDTTDSCCQAARQIQKQHMDVEGWKDIGWNFLIGEDGVVLEGRGWDFVGAHTRSWNYISYGIAIIGEFDTRMPECGAVTVLQRLIDNGIELGYISKNYILYGQCQVRWFPTPGKTLYHDLQLWPHWSYLNDSTRQPTPPEGDSYCLEPRPRDKKEPYCFMKSNGLVDTA